MLTSEILGKDSNACIVRSVYILCNFGLVSGAPESHTQLLIETPVFLLGKKAHTSFILGIVSKFEVLDIWAHMGQTISGIIISY